MTQYAQRLAYSLLLFIAAALPCFGEDWPGWRGPNHNGMTAESKLPLRWTEKENVLWKVPIPGIGHSSPIVWKDKIFVTCCTEEDLSRRLFCISRETGETVWSKIVAQCPIEKMHRDNTPASATPVTDGSLVYTAFQVEGKILISAFSLDGTEQWKRFVGSFESRHGFCTSLVIVQEKLFLSGLQDGPDAFVVAFNKSSGDELWRTARRDKVRSFSSPFPCTIGGVAAILLSGANQTVAYEQATGKVVWELDGPAEKTVSSIAYCDDAQLAFVCGGRDNGFLAVSLKQPEGRQPKVAWRANQGIPYMTSPLASKGKLHILSDEGVYRCYDAASAEVLKEMRPVGPVRASMIANDEYIFVTEKSGKTTVIRNDASWTVVAENDIGEPVMSSLAVSNGDIILRGEKHLFLIR